MHPLGLIHAVLDIVLIGVVMGILATVAFLALGVRRVVVGVRRRVRVALSDGVEAVTSPTWWAGREARRRMWSAVRDAERVVTSAVRVHAPVGDLPVLLPQLRDAARLTDVRVRAEGSTRIARSECRHVEQTAGDIRAAATAALQVHLGTEVDPVLAALRREATAVTAGVTALHRTSRAL